MGVAVEAQGPSGCCSGENKWEVLLQLPAAECRSVVHSWQIIPVQVEEPVDG